MMKVKNVQSNICLAIFFLFANQAWAADWILFDSPPALGNMYYDKSSFKRVNKKIIRVWTKTIYSEDGKKKDFSFLKSIGKAPASPDTLSYIVMLDEIDCVNEKINISSYVVYDEENMEIALLPKSNAEWMNIIPDSSGEKLKRIACSSGKTSKTKKK